MATVTDIIHVPQPMPLDQVAYRFDPSLFLSRHDENWLAQILPYAQRVLAILGAKQGTLLDVGCGGAGLDMCMAVTSDLHFMCTDINDDNVAYASESAKDCGLQDRVSTQQADAQALPFEDNTFDYAMSTQSICGWHNPQKGLEECYRVLKPGGRIFVRGFGDRFRNFWDILCDTGVKDFEMVHANDMSWFTINKPIERS
jgi:ubiquinone/menaquinone biosynthesis C-methylase UbiE